MRFKLGSAVLCMISIFMAYSRQPTEANTRNTTRSSRNPMATGEIERSIPYDHLIYALGRRSPPNVLRVL